MDGKDEHPVTPPLAEAVYPQCPDCEKEFRPGHLCRESMVDEISRMRAAFSISVASLGRISNTLMLWRRGEEQKKLKEVSALARAALTQIQELLQKKVAP